MRFRLMGLGDHNVSTHTHAHRYTSSQRVRQNAGVTLTPPDAAGYHGDPRWGGGMGELCVSVCACVFSAELPI